MPAKNKLTLIHVLEGIQLGLALSILVGPIFFALLQAGIEQGARAGIAVGAGIWVSDILFILSVYFGVSYIQQLTRWGGFSSSLGVAGSIVLIIFGIATLLVPPPRFSEVHGIIPRKAPYWRLWLKGFLINTLNPFTFFFWISVMTTAVLQRDLSIDDTLLFFGAIIGTIILTDILKVLGSKRIRGLLRRIHLLWLRRVSGIALIVFGIDLLVRVFFL